MVIISKGAKIVDHLSEVTGRCIHPNGRLQLVSSGISSFDDILNGGFAIGSTIGIINDQYDIYSRRILKYFMAEGIRQSHNIIHISFSDEDTKKIPKLFKNLNNNSNKQSQNVQGYLKNLKNKNNSLINLKKTNDKKEEELFNFDDILLLDHYEKYHEIRLLDDVKIKNYENVLDELESLLKELNCGFIKGTMKKGRKREFVRIVVDDIFGDVRGRDKFGKENSEKFLLRLSGVISNVLAVGWIRLNEKMQFIDYLFQMESIDEKKNFDGIIFSIQSPRLQSINSVSEIIDNDRCQFVFKNKKNRFLIERYRLQPNVDDGEGEKISETLNEF
ncbi:hypothetical protein SNEBB_010247 [Seison nebaliae]|nr:hypothetical protein SNEBB_010247 [Seison nebaliae]